jgi:hypothetical protein
MKVFKADPKWNEGPDCPIGLQSFLYEMKKDKRQRHEQGVEHKG